MGQETEEGEECPGIFTGQRKEKHPGLKDNRKSRFTNVYQKGQNDSRICLQI
jgi:hypothetical protein